MKNVQLIEVSWEVCNQSGGIYTVIATKVGQALEVWGDRYCLVGPYVEKNARSEWEEDLQSESLFARAARNLQGRGLPVRYGTWLMAGRPPAVLVDLGEARKKILEDKPSVLHSLGLPDWKNETLVVDTAAFGMLADAFITEVMTLKKKSDHILAHFHEWMASVWLPRTKKKHPGLGVIFTTHATMLGRYLASNDTSFYSHVESLDWKTEAERYWIECQAQIERNCAEYSDVFTTVSEVTARECTQFLGRKPDLLLPNGLNIHRFTALHEFQNLHLTYKKKIHDFLTGYFFPSYTFDLDRTLLFFTSGRFEFHNKGYDLTLKALARLNEKLKAEKSPLTIVFFLITRQPTESLNPYVLHRRALMMELRQNAQEILADVEEKFFGSLAASPDGTIPDLNSFVEDYWKFRVRKTLQAWKSDLLPPIVTHNMKDSENDEVLKLLRELKLFNSQEDPVKVVYHPDFVTPMSPLFGMEYGNFVRGCHLGVFPSYYEPWGYTPLESIANGIPTITSDLAGFGAFVEKVIPKSKQTGIQIVHRAARTEEESLEELSGLLWDFCRMDRRERIQHRNRTENNSVQFDWRSLYSYYTSAYRIAWEKTLARL